MIEIDESSDEFKTDPVGYFQKMHEADVTGLKNKVNQLIQRLNKAKSDPDLIEVESLREFKSQADIIAEETKGNYEKAQKLAQDKYDKKVAEYQARAEKAETQIKSLLIDGGISKALDSVHVVDELKEAATLMFKSKAEMVEDHPVIAGKSLEEFIKTWAALPEAKAFIAAPANGGGGSGGGDRPNQPTGKRFDELTETERVELFKTDREQYNSLKGASADPARTF